MSFVDQGRNVRPASVAAVVLVHVAIGYAVVSGLAYTFITHGPTVTIATLIPDDTPQPPPPVTQQLPTAKPRTSLTQPDRLDPANPSLDTHPVFVDQIPAEPSKTDFATLLPPNPPSAPNLSRGAGVVGDRAAWVTTSDYPASAIRVGAEGTTAIRITIGADGRASDCRVTATSGNPALDDAACHTYLRRARFHPALDQSGRPIASEHLDRIRWTLPIE